VVLRWDQSNIPDVVAFNVSRGLPGAQLEPLLRSTSTRVTDRSVSGGTTFCYVVQAVDAAGNLSEPSNQLCVNTDGSAVGGDTETIAGLIVPDIDSVSCTATLASSITSDLTLDQMCYLVNDDVEILEFADVVIPAGTILKFAQNVGLTVTANASLSVNGQQDRPVVLTGQEDSVGYWRGIIFDQSNNSDNQIVNTVVQYAGVTASDSALTVRSFSTSPARLRVQGSVFQFSRGFGVSISGADARIDAFDGNTLTENFAPANFGPLVLAQISTGNSFIGNTRDTINVPRLSVDSDLIIPNLGVPLRTNGLTVTQQSTLTIDAGVEMEFGPGSALFIEQSNLAVRGVADNPVLFTGREKTPGSWGGVHLVDSTSSTLEGLTIEFGGAAVAEHDANLSLVNSTAALSNVVLESSAGFGVFVDGDSQFSNFSNVQQINNMFQQ